jgi:tRNA modification GTPase
MTLGQQSDTIVALSSGQLPSGVAVIRASGPGAGDICALFGIKQPAARFAKFAKLKSPIDHSVIDEGLVLFFPNPASFTGEDLVELQVHGSRAVVQFVLDQMIQMPSVRLAEAGEFTRRAFENGKLDLTRVEGIADLIDAQTESQRALAAARMQGGLSEKLSTWRLQLVKLRAEIEARLDFSDEDDVPFELPITYSSDLKKLHEEISCELGEFNQGRMIREGVRVALVGHPNVGKSSVLNALSRSEVAIVTEVPGTTRDVIEVEIDLGGVLFRLFDTAGIRETVDHVEGIGIERTRNSASLADIVIGLTDDGQLPDGFSFDMIVGTKLDSRETDAKFSADVNISVKTDDGLKAFKKLLVDQVTKMNDSRETLLISHKRDQAALTEARDALDRASKLVYAPELLAEELRVASYVLGRLIGEVGTEDVLDELFAGFCIGK